MLQRHWNYFTHFKNSIMNNQFLFRSIRIGFFNLMWNFTLIIITRLEITYSSTLSSSYWIIEETLIYKYHKQTTFTFKKKSKITFNRKHIKQMNICVIFGSINYYFLPRDSSSDENDCNYINWGYNIIDVLKFNK